MLDAAIMADIPRTIGDTFEQIVRDRQQQVLRTAYRILGNWADAEDVTQEVFVRLHRHGLGFENGAVLARWLYRVTVNVCLDRVRALRPWQDLPELPSQNDSAEAEVIRAQKKQRLMRALAQLSPRERAAVVLREIEGLSTTEVAETLGSSEGTVRSQISKALTDLRRILSQEE